MHGARDNLASLEVDLVAFRLNVDLTTLESLLRWPVIFLFLKGTVLTHSILSVSNINNILN